VIELGMVKIERRISRAGKRIIGKTANGEVTSRMQNRLRLAPVQLPAIGTLFQAVYIRAREEMLDVALLGLGAPLEIDVTR
jgi:hypothetical protein